MVKDRVEGTPTGRGSDPVENERYWLRGFKATEHRARATALIPPTTGSRAGRTAYLVPDDSWVARYYNPATPSHKQRLLFR